MLYDWTRMACRCMVTRARDSRATLADGVRTPSEKLRVDSPLYAEIDKPFFNLTYYSQSFLGYAV
jgi:hypothetical protein